MNNNINKTIEEIEKCLKADLVYPALVLALSIPDMAGIMKWPELSGNKHCKERYCKWFDKYVNPDLNPLSYAFKDTESSFDHNACYALRCSLLHAGETDIGSKINVDNFVIDTSINGMGGVLLRGGSDLVIKDGRWELSPYLYIRGYMLIKYIVDGAKKFLSETDIK